MNRNILTLMGTFVLLVLLQVMLFNNLHLFGFINPMVYLFFIISYRFDSDQTLFIFLSFILGFTIDFLSQSGGAHSISALTIAFLRPVLIRNAFGVTAEIPTNFHNDSRTLNKTIFLAILIGIHHLLYFTFVFFNWNALYLILKNALLTSVISLTLIALLSSLYKKLNDS
jgi:rod shape-determining protein MreD